MPVTRGSCKHPDCTKLDAILRKGYCGKHYNRLLKHGDANFTQFDGRSKHPLFAVWANMKTRCYDKNGKHYHNYGGRGIKVCDRWLGDRGFYNWLEDMPERPTLKHQIDRIDNNGNYEPSNCKWSTKKEQANNTRTNRLYTLNGTTKTAQQWAEALGISSRALSSRIKRSKWTLERALTTEKQRSRWG